MPQLEEPKLEEPTEPVTIVENPFEKRHKMAKASSEVTFGADLIKAVEMLKPAAYDPLLIGKGGEHLVFEIPKKDLPEKYRDVVAKVNFHRAHKLLHQYALAAKEADPIKAVQIQEAAVAELYAEKREFETDIKQMRDYLGADTGPRIKVFIQQMPVNRLILKTLGIEWPEDEPLPEMIPVWVSVQRRLDYASSDYIPLRGYYAEYEHAALLKLPPEEQERIYNIANTVLVDPESPAQVDEVEMEAVLVTYPNLRSIKMVAEMEPVFQEKLKDTVKRLVKYTNEVGTILDFAGLDNIFLMNGEEGWKLQTPDALLPNKTKLSDLQKAVEDFLAHKQPSETARVFNALNTLRVVNALAMIAGIPDRVVVKDIERVPANAWRTFLMKTMYDKDVPQKGMPIQVPAVNARSLNVAPAVSRPTRRSRISKAKLDKPTAAE